MARFFLRVRIWEQAATTWWQRPGRSREGKQQLATFLDIVLAHDQADWTTRREILRTLIKRIVIEPDQSRIVYRINFPLFARKASKEKVLHFCWGRDLTVTFKRVPALCV